MVALVACLSVPLAEPLCTVKIPPMLREPAPVDPIEEDPPIPEPLVDRVARAGPEAGMGQARWHSSRLRKLLLLPLQLPYQKCVHCEVRIL